MAERKKKNEDIIVERKRKDREREKEIVRLV